MIGLPVPLISTINNRTQDTEFKLLLLKSLESSLSSSENLILEKCQEEDGFYDLMLLKNDKPIQRFRVYRREQVKLSVQDMIAINEASEKIIKSETFYGLKDRNGLEAVLGAVDQGFGTYEQYPTLIDKATALWWKIATKQLFNNGNKRTSMLAARFYLNLNYYRISVKSDIELYNISLGIATGQMSFIALRRFIVNHVFLDFREMKNHEEQGF